MNISNYQKFIRYYCQTMPQLLVSGSLRYCVHVVLLALVQYCVLWHIDAALILPNSDYQHWYKGICCTVKPCLSRPISTWNLKKKCPYLQISAFNFILIVTANFKMWKPPKKLLGLTISQFPCLFFLLY